MNFQFAVENLLYNEQVKDVPYQIYQDDITHNSVTTVTDVTGIF